jgi:DoxX-like family
MARVGYRDPVGKATKMLPTIAIWLLVAAFFGAGLFNAIGTTATQDSFIRWGYPRWWCRITGGLEMANAVLIALPASRRIGLVFGAIIIGAALVTVLRHREFSHVAPLSLFVALLVLVAMLA